MHAASWLDSLPQKLTTSVRVRACQQTADHSVVGHSCASCATKSIKISCWVNVMTPAKYLSQPLHLLNRSHADRLLHHHVQTCFRHVEFHGFGGVVQRACRCILLMRSKAELLSKQDQAENFAAYRVLREEYRSQRRRALRPSSAYFRSLERLGNPSTCLRMDPLDTPRSASAKRSAHYTQWHTSFAASVASCGGGWDVRQLTPQRSLSPAYLRQVDVRVHHSCKPQMEVLFKTNCMVPGTF